MDQRHQRGFSLPIITIILVVILLGALWWKGWRGGLYFLIGFLVLTVLTACLDWWEQRHL